MKDLDLSSRVAERLAGKLAVTLTRVEGVLPSTWSMDRALIHQLQRYTEDLVLVEASFAHWP